MMHALARILHHTQSYLIETEQAMLQAYLEIRDLTTARCKWLYLSRF